MRKVLLWFSFIIFLANCFGINVVLVSGQCQSDQRSFLLQIKNSLVFDNSSSVSLVQWGQNRDCCYWEGVKCDGAGRVTGLSLSNESISRGIENAIGLFSLQYLQSLNLAFNKFNATQIPSRLANLTNLSYLNLSNAGFAGQIPIEISNMARLVILDLSSLSFLGSSLLKLENPNLSMLVQNLRELRELHLDGVNISASGNEWCQALSSSLSKLQVLSLSGCFLSGPIDPSLVNLPSLTVIHLDQNNLSSPVPEFLANFTNLTSLQLSNCGLSGPFPERVFQLTTLKVLDLSNNLLLQGSLPDFPQNTYFQTLILHDTNLLGILPDSIGNLKSMSRIDLARCNFTGPIPTSVADLTQLVYLDLSLNNFTGSIPSFRLSKNLTYLDLSHNLLTGAISSTGWEQPLNLVYVDLRFNALNGSIPSSLFAISSLQKLQLANNKFDGQVPDFSNASSSVLDTLDLSGNRLEGPIPMSIFDLKELKILLLPSNKFNGTLQLNKIQRLRNLTKLDLSYNSLAVDASSIVSSFLPQMSTVRLASCNLSKIPDLKNQSKLSYLDLSENQISGEIPNWIWEVGNSNLIYLNLSHNFLMGLHEPYSIPNLSILDMHSNQLGGKVPLPQPDVVYVDYSNNSFSSIPTDIGNYLTYTVFFSLSENMLTGAIPQSICNATFLQVLDLSNNNLGGTIPTCLIQRSDTLGVLNLLRNNLTGIIADTFPGNCELQTLDLNGNQLEGIFPKSLANCRMLEILDLGNNQINDKFPCWLKNVSSLRVLILRSNNFYGNISCQEIKGAWPKLQIVDLAVNRFDGTLPGKCLTTWDAMMADEDEAQSQLKHLRFELWGLNQWYYQNSVTITSKGQKMELVKILTIFTSIDLSCNNFEGQIPEEMGLLKSLYTLNMSHNALTGPIPSSIGNMLQLESLDFSVNKLSGVIPAPIVNLSFLSVVNLSHNHFVGSIPLSTQLQSFSASSFEGNEGLCGPPLTKQCTNTGIILPNSLLASCSKIDWDQLIVMLVGFAISFGAAVAPLMFSKNVSKWYEDLINKFLR